MQNSTIRPVCFLLMIAFLVLACGLPEALFNPETSTQPGSPVYSQFLLDCNTGEQVALGTPIQPDPGCDSWQVNQYERPFNAGEQDRYYPDLDILSAALGRSQHWFYVRLEIYDVNPATEGLEGLYGLEMDLDLDGRGDVLITAEIMADENLDDWSNQGVQAWKDTNNDVGNQLPMRPDPVRVADGYDLASLDPHTLSDKVWVRATLGKPSFVEIAFSPDVVDGDDGFKWWAWVDEGVSNPSGYDYHDFFAHNVAGDVYTWQPFFPSRALFSVDNTCAEFWGVAPPPGDPSVCESRIPPLTETPPCCGFDLCNGYDTPTPTREPTITRVPRTPPSTRTPSPTRTPRPTLTPRPTITPTPTYVRPTPVPPTPTNTRNPFGG
ncbi:MAG: hypothetical protein PVI78_02405 [Anaerolineales bacterium]